MSDTLTLMVYRRLDNRAEGLSDDSPRALELHIRRRDALHEALNTLDGIEVRDWGKTDDEKPHELVELFISVKEFVVPLAIPALLFLGQELVKSGVSTAASEAVKGIISRLKPKQESQQVFDFTVKLPNGVAVDMYPADHSIASDNRATIRVRFPNGRSIEIPCDATEEEIVRLESSTL
jgi:hypothetical protein